VTDERTTPAKIHADVPKLRTGSASQPGSTAAICIVAPMSIAAALG